MSQHDFFRKEAWQMTRSGDPDTSYEAAEKVAVKLREKQQAVYDFIRLRPSGVTLLDIEHHFNDHGSTYRSRASELADMGLVERTDKRRLQHGRNRVVWRCV